MYFKCDIKTDFPKLVHICSLPISRFVIMLHFQVFRTIQSIRSTPASNTVTTKSRTEAMKLLPQIVTYAVVEKRIRMGYKGEQR